LLDSFKKKSIPQLGKEKERKVSVGFSAIFHLKKKATLLGEEISDMACSELWVHVYMSKLKAKSAPQA